MFDPMAVVVVGGVVSLFAAGGAGAKAIKSHVELIQLSTPFRDELNKAYPPVEEDLSKLFDDLLTRLDEIE